LYNALDEFSEDVRFEILFVGPVEADFKTPSNIKHIKTGNIKVTQCNEIAIRNAQGDMLLFLGDDHKFWGGGLDHLYRERQELCGSNGSDNLIYLARFKDKRNNISLIYPRSSPEDQIFASLHCALLDRDIISRSGEGGYADIRFVGVYWDCDLAMRLNGAGVKFAQSKGLYCIEYRDARSKYRLHRICKPHDYGVLSSFWIRKLKEDDVVPSDEIWSYLKNPKWILSRKRLDKFIGYKDEDLLTKSQGPKDMEPLHWD